MKFIKRLKVYLIGVLFGIVLVYFMLIKNRDRNLGAWLPENRVLSKLATDSLVYDDRITACLVKLNISLIEVKDIIKNSEVKFSKSETKNSSCPLYYLEGKLKEKKLILRVESCKEKSTLKAIEFLDESLDC